MRIIWLDEAIMSVDNTADYIADNFGVDRSIEFYDEEFEQTDSLVQFPQKGPVDEDLKGGKYEYRSLGIGKEWRYPRSHDSGQSPVPQRAPNYLV